MRFYAGLQAEDGHWAGDYGGPLFLLPGGSRPHRVLPRRCGAGGSAGRGGLRVATPCSASQSSWSVWASRSPHHLPHRQDPAARGVSGGDGALPALCATSRRRLGLVSSKDASVVMVSLRFSMWSCCLTCPGSGSGMVHLRYPQVAGPAREGLWACPSHRGRRSGCICSVAFYPTAGQYGALFLPGLAESPFPSVSPGMALQPNTERAMCSRLCPMAVLSLCVFSTGTWRINQQCLAQHSTMLP